MDFLGGMRSLVDGFRSAEIRFALIGGMALALRGVQRATMDLDFLLALDDRDRASGWLREAGYAEVYTSENVSHFEARDRTPPRIDLLHAFRDRSLQILDRATPVDAGLGVTVPVVTTEDLIGLKIQGAANDPSRRVLDWSDVVALVQVNGRSRTPLDWELIADYLDLFGWEDKLADLKIIYGEADGG
jgi:hypothetical protein